MARLAELPDRFAGFDALVEKWWDQYLRGHGTVDLAFYAASELGDFGLLWLTIGAGQAAFGPPRKIPEALRLAAALGAESVIVNAGIKSLFRRERPVWDQHRPMRLRKPRTSSFPSGHATSAMTAALLLTQRRTPFAPVYWTLAALVAGSRVHVKIHHPSDVIAGLTIGALLGTVARRVPLVG